MRGLLLAALLVSAGPALAHSWYSAFCCSGRDCAPIAPDALRCTAAGCTVTVAPGHPSAPAGGVFETTVEPKPSQDGQHHVCIVGGRVRCIYYGGGV